jgi:iron-sulfur cluster assembly accessory protein
VDFAGNRGERGSILFACFLLQSDVVPTISLQPKHLLYALLFVLLLLEMKTAFLVRRTNAMMRSRLVLPPLLHQSALQQPQSFLFSSAAAVEKPAARRSIEKKDPIIIMDRAAERIRELLQGESAQGAIGIRLGVKRRGCNGLSYTLNYAFETPKKDLVLSSHGLTVFIEPMALFSIVGTTMDWEETELTSEFTFNNPNSKGECGCGESFNV